MEIWDSRIRHSETQPFGATGPTIKKKQDTIKLDEQHYLQNRNMKTRIFPEKNKQTNKRTKLVTCDGKGDQKEQSPGGAECLHVGFDIRTNVRQSDTG